MRPGADKGLWCCFLMPCALLSACYHTFAPGSDFIAFTVCFSSCFLLLGEEVIGSERSLLSQFYKIAVFLCVAVCFILQWGVNYKLLLCLSAVYLIHKLHKVLLLGCPKSFTIGEAAVVAQLVIVLSTNFLLSLTEAFKSRNIETDERTAYCRSFQVIMQTCIFAVTILYKFPKLRKGFAFYVMCLALGLTALMLWSFYLGGNAFMWMLNTTFKNQKRIFLLSAWGMLTCASVFFVILQQNKPEVEISTITRKWFHLIIAAIYFPGMIFDLEFLYLASAVAVFIFIFLEAVRVLDIWPFGAAIDEAFQIFLDEKDSGFLILTHIYLLIGCSCSLWIFPPTTSGLHASHLSGVISVAFGDTAASIVGSTFGKNRWKSSQKTVEGTVAAILVQFVILLGVLSYGGIFTAKNVTVVLLSTIATSLLEAKTTQVDNLILPIFMFSFLSFVK